MIIRWVRRARMSEPERRAFDAREGLRSLRRQADRRQRRRAEDLDARGTSWAGPGTSTSAALQWGAGVL